jgi:subtilisin family serine protease
MGWGPRRAIVLVAIVLATCVASAGSVAGYSRVHQLGSSNPVAQYWYYCPPGLIDTGTADAQANGELCSFWLLKSFPLGGLKEPRLNDIVVPGLDVLPVWSQTRGLGVTVAVLDTGVDATSADLAPNLLPGWNAEDGGSDTHDPTGHGTLVASIIAAAAGNGGYVGIAPEAKVLPIKVMGDAWSDAAFDRAVEYAIARGARVLNISLGGLNAPIAGAAKALADAQRAGALVVIAAGNDGVDLDAAGNTEYPDGYGLANTLTVADFTTRGTVAPDSNVGARHVQIASLGANLWGDYPSNPTGGYLAGSSAAAATVSGVAALLFAADPGATAAQVRRAIIVGADTGVSALHGKVEANGLLSASGALAALADPDTTPPARFTADGPPFSFRLQRRATERFSWSPARDAELEGYRLTIDGRTRIVGPEGRTALVPLRPGAHRWSIVAYDLSGNSTSASRGR